MRARKASRENLAGARDAIDMLIGASAERPLSQQTGAAGKPSNVGAAMFGWRCLLSVSMSMPMSALVWVPAPDLCASAARGRGPGERTKCQLAAQLRASSIGCQWCCQLRSVRAVRLAAANNSSRSMIDHSLDCVLVPLPPVRGCAL